MKYLVMETHPAYAVVLDERGRFLKTANLHYQVGQTVQDVVELRLPPARRPVWLRAAVAAAALAACLCLGFFGYYRPNFTPYGTLRIQINPDVEMTLSRSGRVLDLKGLNADGAALVSGFAYQGMDREDAASELVARAIVMGYLTDGGTVSVSVASEDADWQAHEAEEIWEELDEHYGSTIRIRMGEAAPDDVPQQAAQSTPAQTPAQSAPPASNTAPPVQLPDDYDPTGSDAPRDDDDWYDDPTGSDAPYDSDDWDDDDDDDDDDDWDGEDHWNDDDDGDDRWDE